MGRSYGDTNLSDGDALLVTTGADRIVSADWSKGVIRAQAGLSLDSLLQICVPKGWFLPVTPGSKFVTLGGAVANDVHGKNHHISGSFGAYVKALCLKRSDKPDPIICTPKKNRKLFFATIGGLGLTGIIQWIEISLKPIGSAFLNVENIPFSNLDGFFELTAQSQSWEYNVAWVDCFAKGRKLGRGIFSRANFKDDGALLAHNGDQKLDWKIQTPRWFLNKFTIKQFNRLYRWRPGARFKGVAHYDPFFYPLDSIANWNRLYGKKGFFQHQCLIPHENAEAAVTQLLELIEQSGQGSFLAVLKSHGPETSGGFMSFCGEGISLALDFPNKGKKTYLLLENLDKIVAEFGGRLYPAKDGRMSSEFFRQTYPQWTELERLRDPRLMSAFWARIRKLDNETSTNPEILKKSKTSKNSQISSSKESS
jgi:L-gulonolactone oxidase